MGQNGDKGKKMNDGCSSIVTTLFSRELSKGRRDMTRLPMTQDKEITEEEEEAALRALSLSLSLSARQIVLRRTSVVWRRKRNCYCSKAIATNGIEWGRGRIQIIGSGIPRYIEGGKVIRIISYR